MIRVIFVFCLFLNFKSSLSQTITITDSTGQPIPYATIEVLKKKSALFANLSGVVDVSSLTLTEKDTLLISSIGYKDLFVSAKKLADKIVLERQIKKMPEVFIYSGEWKKENWGSLKKPGQFGSAWRMEGPGSQFARVIKSLNGNKKPALIYKIVFYTSHAENSRSPVRLRMYEINENGLPGSDILTKTIIEKIDKGKGWLEFDLAGDEIRIPDEGLIVAAEYFDTDTANWNSHKTQFVDLAGKKHKGIINWYGGNFLTDDEENQGVTMMKHQGEWRKFNFVSGKKMTSTILVVQVWVKTPK